MKLRLYHHHDGARIAYREAGNNQAVRRIPGRVEYSDVVLRYGLTDSLDLWNWLRSVNGTSSRASAHQV